MPGMLTQDKTMVTAVGFAERFGLTSRAKTASGGAVESMHDALMEMTKFPLFFKKYCALIPTIRA